MNTLYPIFARNNKLMWFAIIFSLEHFIVDGLLRVATYPVFYSPEYASTFIGIFSVMLPIIIIESVAGGYLGLKSTIDYQIEKMIKLLKLQDVCSLALKS